MSHRLTIKTSINDREALIDALRNNKVQFSESQQVFTLKTGIYNGTTVDLRTGKVSSGDVDAVRHTTGNQVTKSDVSILRQWYAEAKYRRESEKEGVQIIGRDVVEENGEKVVVLTWQTG